MKYFAIKEILEEQNKELQDVLPAGWSRKPTRI